MSVMTVGEIGWRMWEKTDNVASPSWMGQREDGNLSRNTHVHAHT